MIIALTDAGKAALEAGRGVRQAWIVDAMTRLLTARSAARSRNRSIFSNASPARNANEGAFDGNVTTWA